MLSLWYFFYCLYVKEKMQSLEWENVQNLIDQLKKKKLYTKNGGKIKSHIIISLSLLLFHFNNAWKCIHKKGHCVRRTTYTHAHI